jgi:hypothetical protein
MNQEHRNQLSASVYRQLFLMKMLSVEYEFFAKFPLPSGIKNIMFRGKNGFNNCVNELKLSLPLSKGTVDRVIHESDEKTRAMANIFEKLAVMTEEEVLAIETEMEVIKVKY